MFANLQVRLANRPQYRPVPADWLWVPSELGPPQPGQFVIEVIYVSLDPAMRGWLNEGKSYIEPVEIGAVMRALGLGRVVASAHPQFPEGSYVSGMTGVQRYLCSNGSGFQIVDPKLAPLPKYLSVLGMPGMTAYFGLREVGKPKPGETVLVSAATGAVGSIVGQIAVQDGCRAVGIAGGPEKCAYAVRELGYSACIDYKNESLAEGLARTCPQGVDIYFDNVGGDILDAVLGRINRHARILICGAISQYNKPREEVQGPKNYLALLVNRARMEGFIVFDYANRYREAAVELGGWLAQGRLRSVEHIDVGIENFSTSLGKLFDGENFGKLILQVGEP